MSNPPPLLSPELKPTWIRGMESYPLMVGLLRGGTSPSPQWRVRSRSCMSGQAALGQRTPLRSIGAGSLELLLLSVCFLWFLLEAPPKHTPPPRQKKKQTNKKKTKKKNGSRARRILRADRRKSAKTVECQMVPQVPMNTG